jgi:hypothetical protein
MSIKINFILILIFPLFYSNVFSQEKVKTEYENDKYSKMNLSLNGQVKNLTVTTENLVSENNNQIEYYFDKNGQPIKIIEFSLGFDVMAHDLRNEKTVFTFENGFLISELNHIDEGLDGYKYTIDKEGNIIHEKSYIRNRLVAEEIFNYDSQNRLIKSIDYVYGFFRDFSGERPENQKEFISMIETFTYDEMGNLIEDSMDNVKGNVYKKHLYKYDQNGNMIQEGWCKSYKGLSDKNKCNYQPSVGYEYNTKNELTKKYAIGNWSPHNTDTYYKYDDNGNEIEAKGFYITKKDTVLGYHYFYQYNDKGNKIKEDENFGKYRRIGFEKYKTELIEYDNFQNIVLQEFIKSEGQRIKVLKYNYVYDDKGNWIERQKMEGKTSSDLELTERKTREIKYYN